MTAVPLSSLGRRLVFAPLSGLARRSAVILGTALLLCLLLSAPALAKDWRIESMDVILDVQDGGDVLVEETVSFAFEGSFSFVARVVPTDNLEGLTAIEVWQGGRRLPEGGGPGTYQVFDEGDDRVIQVNFALADTSATWTFRYLAQGAIHFFDEGDELRWYVFDAETPVPIDRVSATVRLPEGVPADQMRGAIRTGASVPQSFSSPEPGVMRYEGEGLPPFTEFWTVTGFPKDVVEFHWTWRRVGAFLVPKLGFMLPVVAFLGMLLVWRRRGRDEPQGVFAKYVTDLPSDIPPGVAGALVDEKVDVKEVVATIVDLARRGYLEIIEEKEDGLIFDKKRTAFHRLRPLEELIGFERKVADALFDAHDDRVTTDELKNRFYRHVQPICADVYDEVTRRGFFHRNPNTVRNTWLGIGVGVGLVLVGLGVLFAVNDIGGYGFWLVGAVLATVIVVGFSRAMPQRTPKGAQEQSRWEAFRNYLRDLDRYQDLATARETFESYLPYAVAFGVEREWVRRFQDLQVPGPTWYRPLYAPERFPETVGRPAGGPVGGLGVPVGLPGGGGGWSLDSLSDGLFSSLNNVSNVLTSSPSGSGKGGGAFGGGGGGFGGGFSGGGGGGGFRAG